MNSCASPLILLMNVPAVYVQPARFNSQLYYLLVWCLKQISYHSETIYPSIKWTGQILYDNSWQVVDSRNLDFHVKEEILHWVPVQL